MSQTFKLGGNDLGVIEDKQIAGLEQIRQIADMAIQKPLARLHDE